MTGREPCLSVLPKTDNGNAPRDGLSAGAAAGIGVAVTAGVLLGGFSLYWFIIRKRSVKDLFGKKQ